MLMQGGVNPGGGRDVLFRLKVLADPNARKELADWGKALADVQTKAAETAVQAGRRMHQQRQQAVKETAVASDRERQRELREQFKHDKMIADHHLKEHLRTIAKKEQAQRQADAREIREAQKRDRLIAQNHLREHLRAIHDRERAEIAATRNAQLLTMRRAQGLRQFGRGAVDAGTAVAYSGLVGEQNSQRVLNTLLAVEAGRRGYVGVLDMAKGAGMMGGGAGVAGAGAGAFATAAAAVGALAAAAWAAVSGLKVIGDARKYGLGGGAAPGSYNDVIGGGFANSLAAISGRFASTENLERAERSGRLEFYGGLDLSRRRLSAAEAASAARRQSIASLAGSATEYGQRAIAGATTLPTASNLLGESVSRYRNATAGGVRNEVTAGIGQTVLDAEQNVLRIIKEQRREKIAASQEAVSGAREELRTMKQIADEARRQASEARGKYQSDLIQFGQAGSEERARLQLIAGKRRAGRTLSAEETELASRYSEFREFGESSAIRRARAAGADFLFTEGRSRSARLAREAGAATEAAAKAEVSLNQKVEFVLRVQQDDSAERQVREIVGDATNMILEEMNRQNRALAANVDRQIRDTFGRRRSP